MRGGRAAALALRPLGEQPLDDMPGRVGVAKVRLPRLVPARAPAELPVDQVGKMAVLREVEEQPLTYLSHIRVEGTRRNQVILTLSNVKMIRAAGNYSEFFTEEASYLRRGSLKDLMTRLDPQAFIRINRSEVVRIEEIAEVNPKAHGDAELLMCSGERLKWSRRYRAENGARFEI